MLGRSQLGEEVLPGVLTVLRPWRLAGTGPCTTQKSSGPGAASADIASAAAGVQSYVFIVPLIGAHRAFRSQRPSRPAQAGHGHGHSAGHPPDLSPTRTLALRHDLARILFVSGALAR